MRAKRTDANQKQIVNDLRAMGFSVAITSSEGKGIPDTWLGKNKFTVPLELKTAKGKLTPAQNEFIATWRGSPVVVARTVDEALEGFYAAYADVKEHL